MAASDASVLESLKAARDTVIAQIASGAAVVEYEIRGRRVRRDSPVAALRELESLIQTYSAKSRGSRFRVAKLGPAKS